MMTNVDQQDGGCEFGVDVALFKMPDGLIDFTATMTFVLMRTFFYQNTVFIPDEFCLQ